jgi:ribonuclease J
MIRYRRQINSFLKKVEDNRGKYLVVCTGHQAEKGSILDRIVQGETPFKFRTGDNLIFSSSVIPVSVNINAREKLDGKLRRQGVRLQTDIHVSGHGGREDLRDLLEMLKPENLIPAHGSLKQETPLIDLAKEMGYKFQENSHLSSDGKVIKI